MSSGRVAKVFREVIPAYIGRLAVEPCRDDSDTGSGTQSSSDEPAGDLDMQCWCDDPGGNSGAKLSSDFGANKLRDNPKYVDPDK